VLKIKKLHNFFMKKRLTYMSFDREEPKEAIPLPLL